jgi:hypothetical protein
LRWRPQTLRLKASATRNLSHRERDDSNSKLSFWEEKEI